MNNFLQKYGEDDYKYSDRKTLYCNLKYNTFVKVSNKYYFLLRIIDNKLVIQVYDLKFNLIDEGPFINLESIKERYKLKLSNLAFIRASKKKINNNLYYRYYELQLYSAKDFDTFVKLIKNKTLSINLVGRISRSGEKEGIQRNKGLVFKLKKEKLNLLFNLIEKINLDN